MTKQRYFLLLIFAIFFFTLVAALPIPNDAATISQTTDANKIAISTDTTTDDKVWNFFHELAIQPAIRFLSQKPGSEVKAPATPITFTEEETITGGSKQDDDMVELPKIFGYMDDALHHMANFTYLGYIFYAVAAILLLILLCCFGCCCCCGGCCRKCC